LGFSKGLGEEIKIESEIVKPILKGENIERYKPCKTNNFIFYPHYIDKKGKTKPYEEAFLKSKFPLAYDYIKRFKDELIEKKKNIRLIQNIGIAYTEVEMVLFLKHLS